MKEIRTYGHIKAGRLNISYRSKFIDALGILGDCRIELIVRKLYKKRSNEQNGYYWSVIIGEYIRGAWEEQRRLLTKDQAHEELN